MVGKLRIAMLCLHSNPLGRLGTRDIGGMSVYVCALARELTIAGHQVDIISQNWPEPGGGASSFLPGVRRIGLDIGRGGPLPKGELYAYLFAYSQAFNEVYERDGHDYDVMHSHYWLSGCLGQLLSRGRPWAHVITLHTIGAFKEQTGVGRAEPKRRLAMEKQLIAQCDGLFVAARREQEQVQQNYAPQAGKLSIVPAGVDFQRFVIIDKHTARNDLGLPPHCFLILVVGRADPLKGYERLIQALPKLPANSLLLIAGGDGRTDPEMIALDTLSSKLGVHDRVRFLGSIDQQRLPLYYGSADVFVQTSHYESFGLAPLEAMACGLPVVTTQVGVMSELAEDQCPGVLLTDGTPAVLAGRLQEVADGSAHWPAALIRRSIRHYSWQQATVAATAGYRRAVAAKHI